jgi:hypothetical protein
MSRLNRFRKYRAKRSTKKRKAEQEIFENFSIDGENYSMPEKEKDIMEFEPLTPEQIVAICRNRLGYSGYRACEKSFLTELYGENTYRDTGNDTEEAVIANLEGNLEIPERGIHICGK